MNNRDLYNAINEVDEDILERSETAANRYKKKNNRLKWSVVAACLCLVITGTVFLIQSTMSHNEGSSLTVTENGVSIPQLKVSLSDGESACMIGFFIYQGRCYVQYDWFCDDTDIIGDYLGTATGMINEWTPKDGYVDFAGSVSGDFYAVKGYDPSFMLCMRDTAGAVSTYMCNNGITLKYGSELYEDRLHLSGRFESVQYESRASWFYSRDERYQLNSVNDIILDFIKAIDSAQFVPYDSVPLGKGQTTIADTELYHLYFRMEDGTTIHLRLHKNGYVRFQGLLDLCIQVPAESYSALLELLDNHTDSRRAR